MLPCVWTGHQCPGAAVGLWGEPCDEGPGLTQTNHTQSQMAPDSSRTDLLQDMTEVLSQDDDTGEKVYLG